MHRLFTPLMLVVWLLFCVGAHAHDEDHDHDQWYGSLMQPDNPVASCCGLADAYWCDDYYARDGKAYCKITDARVVPGRPEIAVGTEIEIPAYKLKFEQNGVPTGNPTGHAIVFMSAWKYVFCYVQGGGV